ncbi:sialic acid-binding Ig-like lectin 16 isoform X2 [Bufo bufo]|uniref:sialic acid-binding Ig-like lectin 16 isoform X2 n=1 Tax=Bufo bufo TaxID=8384 RepID=UPI001ABEC77B|nr:sialic acid-binding Ig-like lectin 16 isoform X2 [Bufo bufo]
MILFSLEYYLVLTFLILQIRDNGCEANGYQITVSGEFRAQAGLCVHVPCTFTSARTISRSARGLWYRPRSSEELVASTTWRPEGRMFFTGEVWKGDCSLFINDVRQNDGNSYQFRLEDDEMKNRYNYFNVIPRLTVTGLTDKPEVSVEKLVAGKMATVTCRSPGTCAGSAPHITWNRKNGDLWNYLNNYPNKTSTYFSNITFTPTKDDNRSPLVCRVDFLENTAVTEQTIILNVEYPPDVTITIEAGDTNDTFIVKEGDTKMINCLVDSNPVAEITWFVGDEAKRGPTSGSTLVYSLHNISLSDAGKYWCSGQNDHGTSNRTIQIIVHYPPRTPNIICTATKDCTVVKQQMIYVLEKSTISLLCTAESLPEASLSWATSGPSTNQTKVNGLLTLSNVSLSDEGQFTCEATNNYGKSLSLVNIKVTYKPRTVTGKISSCWSYGGFVECACIIQSFPTANIEWDIDDNLYPSNHNNKELNISTVTVNAMTNSTLILTSSRANIRTIQCIVSNKHGQLKLLLLDYTQSSANTVMITSVSCVVVIVLLLFGGFLVMHHFRKNLSKKPEDKMEINADDCSVIYSNSDVHLYGNQKMENGTNSINSVLDNSDTSLYMNFGDVQYATINFSNLKPKNAPETMEIEYAEIKK